MSPVISVRLFRRERQTLRGPGGCDVAAPARSPTLPLLCAFGFTVAACTGVVDGPGANSGGAGGNQENVGGGGGLVDSGNELVACDPSVTPAMTTWRRLSANQYRNTLLDLVTFAVNDEKAASSILSSVKGLGQLPADARKKLPKDPHGSFRRLDQDVEQSLVRATYEIAVNVGELLSSPTRLSTVVGKCAADADTGNDAACLTSFVRSLGERALRRPLDSDEVEFYRGFHRTGSIDPVGVSDIIAALLTAPQFLYHVEHGAEEVEGRNDVFALTPFELASRLSYQFWDSMPDANLFEAAKSGALAKPEEYSRQLDRVFSDSRTTKTLTEFYREWLKLEDLKPLDARAADPVFRTFAADDLPKSNLHQDMVDDVLSMLRYYTWEEPGNFEDLLSTNLSFAKSADLAKIYGVPAWGGGVPPSFRDDERPGILTRALFLATGSANTRPIMKGVFTRQVFMCDEIPPPPDNAAVAPPDLSGNLSTRQVVEGLTEAPGTNCAGCHKSLINPIGFATENFDSLGRIRSEQPLFSDKGIKVGMAAVNTKTVPQIIPGDQTESNGAADLMRLISRSGKAQACFSRNYFRYSFARWDDEQTDGCAVKGVHKAVSGGKSLRDALQAIATVPEFHQRTIK